MHVATVHPAEWTVGELYALPDDGMRHELLDGTLLVSPPPSVRHQLASRRLVAVRVELEGPDGPVVHAFRLVDASYVAAATLTGSLPQQVALPFPVTLPPTRLVGPRE